MFGGTPWDWAGKGRTTHAQRQRVGCISRPLTAHRLAPRHRRPARRLRCRRWPCTLAPRLSTFIFVDVQSDHSKVADTDRPPDGQHSALLPKGSTLLFTHRLQTRRPLSPTCWLITNRGRSTPARCGSQQTCRAALPALRRSFKLSASAGNACADVRFHELTLVQQCKL